jgi:AAA family ATP:ADP antiporter
MLPRLRRFFDIRPGEGLPVLATFLYIAVVVAAFLLAKPIRNGLFLGQYGPYALVYAYAVVPIVLALFVPAYTRVVARFGGRTVTVGTLVFFSLNVLLFWYAFRYHRFWLLPGVFYVWVNCFGIIAPVQAWMFANSLFDTRQAKRLFPIVGSGASFGAIAGGVLARFLVEPVGGTVNMLLVLAVLIFAASGIYLVAMLRIRHPAHLKAGRPPRRPLLAALTQMRGSAYLRLITALVFLITIATQWTDFQLRLIADREYGGDEDALTQFFGTFNFTFAAVSFAVQLFVTASALRRFGVAVTILVLPLSLGLGSGLILLAPVFWTVLLTNACDQSLRFSVDKPTYELLYLPIGPTQRVQLKNAIDIVVTGFANAVGAVLLGVATGGFLMLPGLGLDLRGTAAINLLCIGAWAVVASRLRAEYVRTIQESIHRHRIDTQRTTTAVLERSAAEALATKLALGDPTEVRFALSVLETQRTPKPVPQLRALLTHRDAEIRRRALAILAAAGDMESAGEAAALLRDPDIGVRTEALLYLTQREGGDPLDKIQELGEVEAFSIRAAMAAFLVGPARNLDAARAVLEAMKRTPGPHGARDRLEAARLIALAPDAFVDLLSDLIRDEDVEVARQAIRSSRVVSTASVVPPLVDSLGRAELVDEATDALATFGNAILPDVEARLRNPATAAEVKRELPSVLLRVGTPEAEQLLIQNLLAADVTLRHRVITSLNKLRDVRPDLRIDPHLVEVLLAAEIAGHYRSYQVLGPLRAQLKDDDPALEALRHSMEQELERVFRLMALLLPQAGLHDAYVGLRSANPAIRANALEFLDNVLKPELRHVLVPVLDSHVTIDERIGIANRLVGAPLETAQQAVETLLASEDVWLRSCAVYAVGALQLHGLEPELRRFEKASDPVLRQSVSTARRRLAGEPAPEHQPAPADMNVGVGAG